MQIILQAIIAVLFNRIERWLAGQKLKKQGWDLHDEHISVWLDDIVEHVRNARRAAADPTDAALLNSEDNILAGSTEQQERRKDPGRSV